MPVNQVDVFLAEKQREEINKQQQNNYLVCGSLSPTEEVIMTKCKTKHARAYQTSFGKIYCPDCGRNVYLVTEDQKKTLQAISEGLAANKSL